MRSTSVTWKAKYQNVTEKKTKSHKQVNEVLEEQTDPQSKGRKRSVKSVEQAQISLQQLSHKETLKQPRSREHLESRKQTSDNKRYHFSHHLLKIIAVYALRLPTSPTIDKTSTAKARTTTAATATTTATTATTTTAISKRS